VSLASTNGKTILGLGEFVKEYAPEAVGEREKYLNRGGLK
jgi:hypothetical protein